MISFCLGKSTGRRSIQDVWIEWPGRKSNNLRVWPKFPGPIEYRTKIFMKAVDGMPGAAIVLVREHALQESSTILSKIRDLDVVLPFHLNPSHKISSREL
jgi:hypothetical protein